MPYVTYTEVGWAQDGIMADEIMKALKASDERDFIMAITVESHGKYDENYIYHSGDPEILQLPEQINPNRFASYLHLIHETDAFLGKLIDRLEKFDEPTDLRHLWRPPAKPRPDCGCADDGQPLREPLYHLEQLRQRNLKRRTFRHTA